MKRLACFIFLGLLVGACSLVDSGSTPESTSTLPDPAVTTISAPNPDATARRFLEAWKAEDYATMYALLSPLAQDGLSRDEFTARYEEVWREAALTGIDCQIVSSLVISPQSADVRYRVTLHSAVVGDITGENRMDLKREEGEWKVAWTDAVILPELADGNGLLLARVTPTRANIYDRNGLALATQTDAVALWIVPNQIGDEEAEGAMLGALSRLLDRSAESIQALYDDFRGTDYYTPLGVVSLEKFQQEQGTLSAVGGVQWRVYNGRYYFGGGIAPHAIGYVSWIVEEKLDDYLDLGYQGDEYVGQIGIEYTYESELRGEPGGTLYLMDAEGQVLKVLATRDPEPPLAVYTTLDRDLQRHAQQAIAGFNGAIVVLERDTGAVLALVSSPGFDPHMFDVNNPNWQYQLEELNNPNRPLVNRATSAGYPLGSVFKIITMSAALESGFYGPDTQYTCNGEFRELPGQVFYDWTVEKDLPDHGTINLIQGLERSCNPFFWHIGLDLYNRGLTTALPEMAEAFGLGQPAGIEIGDWGGIVPDPTWKQENLGEDWGPGDAVQLAIGQASLNVTPLQVVRFVSAVGNGGTLYLPQIIQSIQSAEGEIKQEFKPEVGGILPISLEHLEIVRQAMAQVVSEPHGTAYRRFLNFSIDVAGKTGTAESGLADPHAWFAGYTYEGRTDKPDIAVVVLVEYQGEGSDWAAPIFLRVVESYFFGRPSRLYRWESRIGVPKTPTPTPDPEDLDTEGTPSP